MNKHFKENEVIRALRTYSKSQFRKDEETKESDGLIFYSFTFKYKNVDGYITAEYNPNKRDYKSITMNCNFDKTLAYYNCLELKGLMDYIRRLFNA